MEPILILTVVEYVLMQQWKEYDLQFNRMIGTFVICQAYWEL